MIDGKTVLDLFAQQLDKHYDQQAVCSGNKWLTFNDLEQRSGSICRQLVNSGVKRGDMVGFIQSHDIELPALILGILKSGGICVPMDPLLPVPQLRSVLHTLPVKYIISQYKHVSLATRLRGGVIIADQEGATSKAVSITSNDGAFVFFTSATTGKMKAVIRSHLSLASSLQASVSSTGITSPDCTFLLRSAISHTVVSWELLFPLVAGFKLIIAPHFVNHDPVKMTQLLIRHNVTYVCLSPAHLRLLVVSKEIEKLGHLETIETSGEVLPKDIVKTVLNKTKAKLVSVYGCTEVPAVASHQYFSSKGTVDYIGKVRDSMELRLLDSEFNPVLDGNVGEMFVSNPNMPIGYVNNEVETRKRFVNIADEKGGIVVNRVFFRTGDLGRLLDNGEYEYLGRIDRQVQINGYRVELQELETLLRGRPSILDAYVTYSELPSGLSILCAYLIAEDHRLEIEHKDLRAELLELIPEYKIPKLFVQVNSFPMNNHHKIDREQLPSPESVLKNRKTSTVPELSSTEELVSAVWGRFLGVTNLQPTDDFFLLGGDSFSAISMLNAFKDEYQFDLGLDLFLDATTLSKFSDLFEKSRRSK